jgi:hypothetical protein
MWAPVPGGGGLFASGQVAGQILASHIREDAVSASRLEMRLGSPGALVVPTSVSGVGERGERAVSSRGTPAR